MILEGAHRMSNICGVLFFAFSQPTCHFKDYISSYMKGVVGTTLKDCLMLQNV